jgi:hypothetical protein
LSPRSAGSLRLCILVTRLTNHCGPSGRAFASVLFNELPQGDNSATSFDAKCSCDNELAVV